MNYYSLQTKKQKEGFTLIELVMYMAVFVIVVLFLFQFLFGILASQAQGIAREETINNAVQAINRINFEVRHAKALYEPTSDFDSDIGQLSLVTTKETPTHSGESYVDIYVSEDERLCIKREDIGINCVTSEEVRVTRLEFNKIDPEVGVQGAQTMIEVEYVTHDENLRIPFELRSSASVRHYE